MYDDPMNNEPPPPFPRCPNCNEQMTDHPLTTEASKPGEPLGAAICAGTDGCGWWGTWEEAVEYEIAKGEARAEAMADAGPDWRSEYRPHLIPVGGHVPFEDDPEVSRWLATSSYESPEAWMRDSDYYESEGGWFTGEGHGPIDPLDAIAGAMEAEAAGKPLHERALPEGYFLAASGDKLPFFEGRAIVLRFWPDSTVTWQLRDRDGGVLEPSAEVRP